MKALSTKNHLLKTQITAIASERHERRCLESRILTLLASLLRNGRCIARNRRCIEGNGRCTAPPLLALILAAVLSSAVPAQAQGNGYQQAQYQPQGQYPQQMPYAQQGQYRQQGYPSQMAGQQSYGCGGQAQYQPMPPMMPPGQPAFSGGGMTSRSNATAAPHMMSVAQWFQHYDQIRHEAQMNPQEKFSADNLMSRGLSILMPGPEKIAAKSLLSSLAVRYDRASQQMRNLPAMKQTDQLHHMYYQYFISAAQLFGDYVRVQDNLLVTDASTGQPLASQLIQRKQMLEALEHQCKALDAQTRQSFAIAPYPY